jgi:hypothetical protein
MAAPAPAPASAQTAPQGGSGARTGAGNAPGQSVPQPAPAQNSGGSGGISGAQVEELKVTGHLMTLPPGLFCVINEISPGGARANGMPGVRISPPPAGGQNVEISGFRSDG